MYAGDASRKETLVKYGFRLPSAKDNRPIIYRIFGVLVATSGGDLDLYVACEQNLQYVGVDPGSVLEVRKF
jgi:hypothetical protein